jgi:hypothetical protein
VVKKRKSTGISGLLFEDVDPYGAVIGEASPQPMERFPLSVIRPDPEQPRRLLPADLADEVNQGKLHPTAVMQEWLKRGEADSGSPLSHEIRELRRLATSIEQHGLINPITIRPADFGDNRFVIVTGERRYWAHVLLSIEARQVQEGGEIQPANMIKATLVPQGASIRAHQIIENLMREDINVIEKAYGLWALRRELTDDAYRRHSNSDSEPPTKPRLVAWKEVEDALDMSRQYRARIIAVLNLSEEAQQLVDQHNLAEATIRPILEKLKQYPDLQMQALRQLVVWQEAEARNEGDGRRIVPSVIALVDKLLAAKEMPKDNVPRTQGLDFGKFRQKISGTLRYMQRLDDASLTDFTRILDNEAGGDIVDELHALRNQIDAILSTIPKENG